MDKDKVNINNLLVLCLMIYTLFTTSSIKRIFSPVIAGYEANNLILIIPVFIFLKFFFIKKRVLNFKLIIWLLLIFFYLLINYLNFQNDQSMYSILIIILPMLLITEINDSDGKNFEFFLKTIVLVGLIYSGFVIVLFYFYNMIAAYLHLPYLADYVTRHSTMIGSSITTSYYLLMSIPFGFIGTKKLNKKWKIISIIYIIMSTIAVVLEQSRICFIALGFYSVLYFLMLGKTMKKKYKVLFVVSIMGLLIWVLNNPNLSRLYKDYADNASFQTRSSLLVTGFKEFSNHPIFGSGLATYYKRLWSGSPYIYIGDDLTLLDSHNVYIYILVEQGITGFILYFGFIFYLFKKHIKTMDDFLKKNIYILLIGQSIVFCGGSQLINEINYATIFWLYLFVLCSKGIFDKKCSTEPELLK